MRSKTVRNVIIFSIFAILCGWVGKAFNDPQVSIEQGQVHSSGWQRLYWSH